MRRAYTAGHVIEIAQGLGGPENTGFCFPLPSRAVNLAPNAPRPVLIAAIIELNRRYPKFGCVRIAQQISHAFGVDIDKDIVRRVLAKHYAFRCYYNEQRAHR